MNKVGEEREGEERVGKKLKKKDEYDMGKSVCKKERNNEMTSTGLRSY